MGVTMSDLKKQELIKKIKALAERGEGGEKEGAQKKLRELMQKYGIEDLDLSDDVKNIYEFQYKNTQERQILLQLLYKKYGEEFVKDAYKRRKGRGSRSQFLFRCTRADFTTLSIEYEFYVSLWNEEVEFFLSSFIQKHKLFSMHPSEERIKTMSFSDQIRMEMLMNGMKDCSLVCKLPKK